MSTPASIALRINSIAPRPCCILSPLAAPTPNPFNPFSKSSAFFFPAPSGSMNVFRPPIVFISFCCWSCFFCTSSCSALIASWPWAVRFAFFISAFWDPKIPDIVAVIPGIWPSTPSSESFMAKISFWTSKLLMFPFMARFWISLISCKVLLDRPPSPPNFSTAPTISLLVFSWILAKSSSSFSFVPKFFISKPDWALASSVWKGAFNCLKPLAASVQKFLFPLSLATRKAPSAFVAASKAANQPSNRAALSAIASFTAPIAAACFFIKVANAWASSRARAASWARCVKDSLKTAISSLPMFPSICWSSSFAP